MIRNLFGRRIRSDYQLSYWGGPSVRRVERGRDVEWYVDDVLVPEAEARARMAAREEELHQEQASCGENEE